MLGHGLGVLAALPQLEFNRLERIVECSRRAFLRALRLRDQELPPRNLLRQFVQEVRQLSAMHRLGLQRIMHLRGELGEPGRYRFRAELREVGAREISEDVLLLVEQLRLSARECLLAVGKVSEALLGVSELHRKSA
jgi:hypothetical protein